MVMTSKQRSRSFILVPIDFSYTTSYRLSIAVNNNFYTRMHRLATIHHVTDDRREQHCTNSAAVSIVFWNQQRAFVVSPEAKSDKNETPGGGQKMYRGQ